MVHVNVMRTRHVGCVHVYVQMPAVRVVVCKGMCACVCGHAREMCAGGKGAGSSVAAGGASSQLLLPVARRTMRDATAPRPFSSANRRRERNGKRRSHATIIVTCQQHAICLLVVRKWCGGASLVRR